MTNFNHFDKPVVHFGNAHEERPLERPVLLEVKS